MAEPIQAKVIRSWDSLVISAYWDRPTGDDAHGWFVIRQVKFMEGQTPVEKTIRLSPDEVETLIQVIKHG